MIVSINNSQTIGISPMYGGKKISVAIDSSKRNTAITIGDEWCDPIDVIEFDGKADGTSELDVLQLAKSQRNVLKTLLQGATVKYVGIENIITVDKGSKQAGISQHMSRFKITAIFMSLISFFQDNFDVTPTLINNKSWKSAVLPEEFTRANVYKGSLQYYKSIGSKYGNYTDDATDSLCILRYMKSIFNVRKVLSAEAPEICAYAYDYYITRVKDRVSDKCVEFLYNYSWDIITNVEAVVGKLLAGGVGYARVPIDVFDTEVIFKHATGEFDLVTREVFLVVRRR